MANARNDTQKWKLIDCGGEDFANKIIRARFLNRLTSTTTTKKRVKCNRDSRFQFD